MPNSFVGLAQRFPAEKEGQSLEEQVRELRDYSYQLLEYLRYALQNLEPSNFNEQEMNNWITKPIQAEIRDVNGNMAQLALTAEQLAVQMSDANSNIAQLQVTAQGLNSTVTDQTNQISKLTQTANNISATVSGVVDTVDDLGNTVQTVKTTMVTVNSDGMIVNTNGKATAISGNCITTGKILADHIGLYGWLRVYEELDDDDEPTGTGGYIGYTTGWEAPNESGVQLQTEGIGIASNKSCTEGYVLCTDGGARIGYGDSTALGCAPSNIYASQAISEGSDKRIKNTIEYNLAENYEAMYRALKPCRFKRNDGKSDRFHTGFVAQEIEEAVIAGGLTAKDLAAYCVDDSEDKMYSVRYSELIALNTAMIQKLMDENDALKARVAALEGGNNAT